MPGLRLIRFSRKADSNMRLIIPIVIAIVALQLQANAQSPVKVEEEHKWLQQYVGEWNVTSETKMEPGAEPTKTTSTESVRPIGPLWVLAEGSANADGKPFRSVLTLGYDPEEESFVGTWIDSATPYLWTFAGKLDEAKKVLTLETEGPKWGVVGTKAKYREQHEFVNPNHRTTASSIQNDDGTWFTFLRTECHRKN